jgi:hypothetical protein
MTVYPVGTKFLTGKLFVVESIQDTPKFSALRHQIK